jgi:hypothetical protein
MALRLTRLTSPQPLRHKKGRRRLMLSTLWRVMREGGRVLRRVLRAVLALPPIIRAIMLSSLVLVLWLWLNWMFHAFHKPTEILFPLDRSLNKHPVETWREYESLFREHATTVITPEFLSALAQVEGAGNPVARTYWRWELTWNPLGLYQPASTAVGMYQITDGTFDEATRYCIHDHQVVDDGPWHDLQSCWFNSLYTRIVPSHSIELTAALLHRRVAEAVKSRWPGKVTLRQKQDLAAVIHLCGAGAGRAYAARGFKLTRHRRCGDHDVRHYLARIKELQYEFTNPAAGDKTIRQAR